MLELIIDVAGIVVTVISIAVTINGIVLSVRNNRHQKSNPSDQD